jgi:enamine deaminase RidA (YjgF/YER057c/UK114 family)
MSARVKVDPGWKWDDRFNYSQGIQIGNSVYVSGQVALDAEGNVVGKGDMKAQTRQALDAEGNVVGKGDMKAQTRQALENVKTVLEASGASMEDVVKVTVYVTDISLLAETHDVRSQFFPDPPPASTGVEISALAFPDLLVEIEAVAVKS